MAVLSLPAPAIAQKYAFVDAFIEFHSALSGKYGDEGPRVTAALDRMAASLDAWERASRDQERALTARSDTSPADLALVYLDEHRLAAAIDTLERAIAAEPRRAPYYVLQGQLLRAEKRTAEAGAAFASAHTLDPSDPIAAYLLATHLAADGGGAALTPLVATLRAAVTAGGGLRSPFPRLTLVDDLWSSTAPVFSPAAYADGFASMAAGRFREALERFRADAAQDPLVTESAARTPEMIAGTAALREHRAPDAVAQLEAASAARPTSAEAQRILGLAYREKGELAASIARLEAAVRLDPRMERARIALGTVLLAAGQLDRAEQVLRDTIEILPASGEARWVLAQVYEQLDRSTDAIVTLEGATPLTVMAGKSHLYEWIAQLAYGYHRDISRAIPHASQRTWLLMNEPRAHKYVGLVYFRAGRMDEALVELMMATLLGYTDAEMLAAVGQIDLAAGRLELAEATARRAVALDPDLAQARYILGSTLLRLDRRAEGMEQLSEFKRLQAAAFQTQWRNFERTKVVAQARSLAKAGRFTEAAAAFEKACSLDASREIYQELAAVYARLGRNADRARALARAEEIDATNSGTAKVGLEAPK